MVEQLIVCGQFTEQCVLSAVRDAADLGYFVTVVEDACAAQSLDQHTRGLQGVEGFSRILSTRQILEELT
jgi:ureidoacrylate peracid hydrolase